MSEVVNWIVVEPGFRAAGLNPFRVRNEILKGIRQWQRVLDGLVAFQEGYSGHGCVAFQMNYGVINTRKHPNRIAQCNDFGNNWRITFLPHGAPATVKRPKQKWATSWWGDIFGSGHSLVAATIHEVGHIFDLPHKEHDPLHPMHPDFPDDRSISRHYRKKLRDEFLALHG